jgi:photosystem II stability/assembly factor-like uncharacterized protein
MIKQFKFLFRLALMVLLIHFTGSIEAQKNRKKSSDEDHDPIEKIDEKNFSGLSYRHIGPFRGGRAAAVTGVSGNPNLYYMGATGGGVWKTENGGQTWNNISDGFFGGSIGSISVAPSDNNVIYVGGGEHTVRGNVSAGHGMWRSENGGKSWESIGMENAKHIPRIRVHPNDYNIVFAAVLGNLFKPSKDRGIYKSIDGGKTWKQVLFANEHAGAFELIMDPNNPRIMYASTWRIQRTPYSLESGGEGSEIWKSTDSGETWIKITDAQGLPKGTLGVIGLDVSPINSDRVWAIIEADNGGVFRSDDGGHTWQKVNSDRSLRQRAWYYTRIYADTKDIDMVYVLNVSFHRSANGGKSFESFRTPHSDHHDLWIAPEDNQRMIVADDGGAQVSFDGAQNWSTYYNQPTAQFYRVTTDNHFPYRIYVAQQDNSTLRINHRSDGSSIDESDWEETAGGESAHLAIDPLDQDIVYGGSYSGYLQRYNHRTKQSQNITVWPDNPMGYGAEGMKYRFQWNFPIFFSPHHPNKLYALSNQVHVTTDGGHSWELLSEDLTRNESEKLGPSGGPITKDNTSVEYYCTLFAGAESPYEEGLIWVGSDDGLLHLTKDGGQSWENVTPEAFPKYLMINSIEPDPFVKGGAYIAGTQYKLGDEQPYLFYTSDYGQTWKKIVNGIASHHFTRVLRADPKRQGLLYAGTEAGMYISFDNGDNWQPFQLNLPIVPITDLTIKNDNLIVATQGRSLWIIDDLTILHQISDEISAKPFHLFQPMPSYRIGGRGWGRASATAGENHPGGVMIYFNINEELTDSTVYTLSIKDKEGKEIRTFSTQSKERDELIKINPNGNRFVWNMRYSDALSFKGLIMWAASTRGPLAVPGTYSATLSNGKIEETQEFTILGDPRSPATQDDYQLQFDFLNEVIEKLTETHQAIIDIRSLKNQINEVMGKYPDLESLSAEGKAIIKELSEIEQKLYQTKNQSNQDPLNFPIQLNNKLAHLNSVVASGNFKPTQQAVSVKDEITNKINMELKKFDEIKSSKIPALNQMVKEASVDLIKID